MTLDETLYRLADLAVWIEEYVEDTGALPDDYKARLQQIRRLCDKLLVGEYEEDADGGPR